MRTTRVTTTTASGEGALTAKLLRECLAGVPEGAVVDAKTHDSQREGTSWSFSARYTETPGDDA